MGQYCTPEVRRLLTSVASLCLTCAGVNGPPISFVTSPLPHKHAAVSASALSPSFHSPNPRRAVRIQYLRLTSAIADGTMTVKLTPAHSRAHVKLHSCALNGASLQRAARLNQREVEKLGVSCGFCIAQSLPSRDNECNNCRRITPTTHSGQSWRNASGVSASLMHNEAAKPKARFRMTRRSLHAVQSERHVSHVVE